MKKALILWYTIGENFGDVLIFRTVHEYLQRLGYQIEDADIGLPWHEIVKKTKGKNLLWFAGGGIIERGVPDIIQNFRKYYIRRWMVPYGVTGLSIGQFNYDTHKKNISTWIRKSTFFYSRDEYTSQILNKLTNSNTVKSNVDVVLSQQFPKSVFLENASGIGVNFRNVPYPDLTGDIEWELWGKSLYRLSSGNQILIPDQTDDWKKLKLDFDILPYNVNNVIYSIQKCRFVIAMRFHVILVAAIYGIPSIPIVYCPKVERLSIQLGLQDLMLGIHDYNLLEEKVSFLNKNFTEITNKMNFFVKEMKIKSNKIFSNILSDLT